MHLIAHGTPSALGLLVLPSLVSPVQTGRSRPFYSVFCSIVSGTRSFSRHSDDFHIMCPKQDNVCLLTAFRTSHFSLPFQYPFVCSLFSPWQPQSLPQSFHFKSTDSLLACLLRGPFSHPCIATGHTSVFHSLTIVSMLHVTLIVLQFLQRVVTLPFA